MGWQGTPSERMVREAERKRTAARLADAARAYLAEGTSNNRIALEAELAIWRGLEETVL